MPSNADQRPPHAPLDVHCSSAVGAQALLAAIVESSTDAIISKDLRGIVTSWNAGATRMFGYTAGAMIGQPITILLPPDRQGEEQQILDCIARGERVESFETVRRCQDGSLIDVSIMVSPIRDAQGQIIGASKITRDITAHHRAEEQLRVQAELLDQVSDAIIATDMNLIITSWNHAAEQLYGWSAAEAIGRPMQAIVPTDYGTQDRLQILATLHRQGRWQGEVQQRHRDGTSRTIFSSVSLRADRTGQTVGTVGVNRDITARTQAEAALRASEALTRSILDTLPAHIVLLDATGVIVDINRAWEHFARDNGDPTLAHTGIGTNYLATCQAATGPDSADALAAYQGIRAVLQGQSAMFTLEYPCHSPTEERWFQLRVTPCASAQQGVVVAHEPITAAKRAERTLRDNEQRYRAIFEQAATGTAQVALDGRFLDVNQRLCAITGYPRAVLLQKSVQQLTYPADHTANLEQVRRLLAGETDTFTLEKRYVRADATLVWINLTVALLRNAAGAPDYFISTIEDISARKQAEAALRASEETLRIVTEAAGVGFALVDTSHRYYYSNQTHRDFLGSTEAKLVGRHVADVLGAQYQSLVRRRLERAFAGEVVNATLDLPLGSGGLVRHCEVRLERSMFRAEPVVVVVMIDITERVQTEQAIERTAERLRSLRRIDRAILLADAPSTIADTVLAHLRRLIAFEHASVVLYDPDMTFGTELARYPDQPPAPAVGTQMQIDLTMHLDAMHHDAPVVISDFDTAAQVANWPPIAGARSVLLARLVVQGALIGSLTLIALAPDAFTAEHGEIVHEASDMLALAIASARQQEREQRARRIAELLHTASQLLVRPLAIDDILETLLDVLQQLIPYDTATILLPDPAVPTQFRVRHLRGYERWVDSSLVSAFAFELQTNPLLAEIVATRRSRLIPNTAEEPAWQPTLAGAHIACWLGVPLIAGEGVVGIYSIDRTTAYSLTSEDMRLAETLAATAAAAITRAQLLNQVQNERTQLAERVDAQTAELRVANAELARAARLKDEFLASMSHELRTPLSAILGRSEALEEGIYGPITAKQHIAFESITASGRHLLALINDILDVAKIETGNLTLEIEPVIVADLCRASVQMLTQAALGKRITVTSTLESAVTIISADVRRLKQILVNLLSNAVKFTPTGGQVGLEVRGDADQKLVTFTIWDTGIGIAADDLPKLFQPFVQIDSRLSREYEGTGLGLALVRRLAEAHGGTVTVDSVLGQGSRFHVTLPWMLHAADAPVLPLAPGAAEQPARPVVASVPSPLILLAEDNALSSTMLQDYLESHGYRVVVAHDGVSALTQARAAIPALIVMDIQMPGMDGLQAIRGIRADAQLRQIPIIALTALAMPGDRERCLHAGANEYLTKPVSLRALHKTIGALLATSAS